MAMEVGPATNFDWANDAFVALNDSSHASTTAKWTAFHPTQPTSFGIPPSLLTQSAVEQYGQVTPPEELSPAEPHGSFRQQSPPVEVLRNEASWPGDAQMQALADYQPSPGRPSTRQHEQTPQPSSSKRRRTTRVSSANHNQVSPRSGEGNPATNPQPAKRKRGRPKSQPQPSLEAYDQEGLPFQVSSARQTHLEKNRVAAHKCRQRKKEYINSLESRARDFSTRNKHLKENVALLREEVLELKNEVLRHAGCGFWAVDEYLARCAGDLLGMDSTERMRSMSQAVQRPPGSQVSSPSPSTMAEPLTSGGKVHREDSHESLPSQGTTGMPEEWGSLDLLKDMDEEMKEAEEA